MEPSVQPTYDQNKKEELRDFAYVHDPENIKRTMAEIKKCAEMKKAGLLH